jgi:glycosyltransferase involved in cell wall biosynthesis
MAAVSAQDVAINACGLIPVYNNPMTLERVVSGVLACMDSVIIVDDGSTDDTRSIAERLAADSPAAVYLQRLPHNSGKGAAVQAGQRLAQAMGFTHVLQVDADGQHDLRDIPDFLARAQENPRALIAGSPVFGPDIPAVRLHGRKLTTLVTALEAGSLSLPDAMCGFRVYPLAAILSLGRMGKRMIYDPEVLVRASWAGIPIVAVPTRVRYLSADEGGVSHFRMLQDNVINVCVHGWLVLQAPLRWLLRAMRKKAP